MIVSFVLQEKKRASEGSDSEDGESSGSEREEAEATEASKPKKRRRFNEEDEYDREDSFIDDEEDREAQGELEDHGFMIFRGSGVNDYFDSRFYYSYYLSLLLLTPLLFCVLQRCRV